MLKFLCDLRLFFFLCFFLNSSIICLCNCAGRDGGLASFFYTPFEGAFPTYFETYKPRKQINGDWTLPLQRNRAGRLLQEGTLCSEEKKRKKLITIIFFGNTRVLRFSFVRILLGNYP